MIRVLNKEETLSTRIFGGTCPYFYHNESAGHVYLSDSAMEIIPEIPREKLLIDPVACLGLLCFNYPLGDRCLIQGLQRMPWHSTIDADGNLTRHPPIPHGHRLSEPNEIANSLLVCLEEELSTYIENHKKVWILLSGGLDSRITAGVVQRLNHDFSAEIHAITWGTEKSRDVAYAERIARQFGWEWHLIPYSESTLWQNLNRAVEWGGAEVAAVHLHGMHELRDLVSNDDLVIASSWGDSIGRAEFSGHHLSQLSIQAVVNKYGLIHRSLSSACLNQAEADRRLAWSTEPDCSRHIIAELDSQENYMRRLIGHAMNYVSSFCRIEQAFTAEKTVRTMWSFSPICRQTEVYFCLLKKLDSFLYNLPWARTGIAPSGVREQDHSLTTTYHQWGRWLREGRRSELKDLVCDGGLSELGIFNMCQVRQCYRHWLQQPIDTIGRTETILQLAAIELLRRKYDLICHGDKTGTYDFLLSIGYGIAKKMKNRIPIYN